MLIPEHLKFTPFFLLDVSSQLTSNKSLLNQGTGDYGMEENARMTGLFTSLAHKDIGQAATTHLEFGAQFKEMLVNASPKGCVISITMLVVTAHSVEAVKKLELPPCSCFDMGYMVYTN